MVVFFFYFSFSIAQLFCSLFFSFFSFLLVGATNNPLVTRQKSAAAAKRANQKAVKKGTQIPKHGPFAIKIFFLGSSSPPCELVVSSSDLLSTVKQKIEFQQGIPAERMHLFVGRRQIGESTGGKKGPTVGSVGLKPNQAINVVLN